MTLHGLFTQENTPLEIVEIGQTVTKVNLLYLARITALTSIIYNSVNTVLIATHCVIGEKQLTIVYFWNHLKLYLNWFIIVV